MSEIKNVVIIGAGGNLGPSILKAVLDSKSFNVTVLSREGSKSTFPSGVNVVHANYDSVDSLKAAFTGQDAVLSLVGNQGFTEQQKIIDAAIAAGVKRFLPSEFGSNTADQRVKERVPVFAAKIGTVDYLKSKESEISWSAIINGPFFDWGLLTGFIGFNAATKTATLVDEGKAVVSVTNLSRIGEAVVKVLQNPELSKNQYIFISSFETTQKEILDAAEEITGEKWTVNHVNSEDLYADGFKKLQTGDHFGAFDLIKAAAVGKENLGDLKPAGLFNEKLGLTKEDYKESVKAGLAGKLYGAN